MTNRSTLALLAVVAALAGCRASLAGLQAADVEQAASLHEHADVTFCDANTAKTRERYGVIPGAVLLSNYRDFDATGELPSDPDRTLVFYCHSPYCGAAADAARKALAWGHTDVWVLEPGITGWVEAGLPVDRSLRRGGR